MPDSPTVLPASKLLNLISVRADANALTVAATVRVVGAPKPSGDASLAAPFGQEEEPAFGAVRVSQVRTPTSGVGLSKGLV